MQCYRHVLLFTNLCVYISTWLRHSVAFLYLMGVFGISVHAKDLNQRGGNRLFSKGRKAI